LIRTFLGEEVKPSTRWKREGRRILYPSINCNFSGHTLFLHAVNEEKIYLDIADFFLGEGSKNIFDFG
jgi:hypothetical protein